MASPGTPTSNTLSAILKGFRNRPAVPPVVPRLLELCVVYQQEQQNSQNAQPSSSASTNNMAEFNHQAEKKIKALVKNLTRTRRTNSIDELERAILHRDSKTKCVTVPKSFDASSSRTCVVDYCRLWRWSDLANQNQLKPVDYCLHAFHYHHDEICVNPFHYERVATTYSVCVPRLLPQFTHARPDLRAPSFGQQNPSQPPQNATYHTPIDQQASVQSPAVISPGSVDSQEPFHSPISDVANGDDIFDSSTSMDLDLPVTTVTTSNDSNALGERVLLEEPREWCRLSYYEMSSRVGEQYRVTQSQVIIDGFTNPSNAERFCLGSLSNIHRTPEVERCRRVIGAGVKLFEIRGNVFAECLSQNPVFVQSPIANRRQGWHPATVCKIEPNVRFQIFDINDFTEVLTSAISEGYESVFNLMKMCILRMSLVKGWGVDYGRPLVTSTPCWIEIHLDGPLKWLDNVLQTMRGPTDSITSVS